MDITLPKIKFGELDAKELGEKLATTISKSLEGLISGAQEDLAKYANRMADDAIRVMQIPEVERREKLLEELGMQVKLIGEIHRIEATQEGWKVAGSIFKTVIRTAVGLMIPS
jgi:hypothetical protein